MAQRKKIYQALTRTIFVSRTNLLLVLVFLWDLLKIKHKILLNFSSKKKRGNILLPHYNSSFRRETYLLLQMIMVIFAYDNSENRGATMMQQQKTFKICRNNFITCSYDCTDMADYVIMIL